MPKSVKTSIKCSICNSKLVRFTDSGKLYCFICQKTTSDQLTKTSQKHAISHGKPNRNTTKIEPYSPYPFPNGKSTVSTPYRGILPKTLDYVGGIETEVFVYDALRPAIHFPIVIDGFEVGGFSMFRSKLPDNRWFHMHRGLQTDFGVCWPFDIARKTKSYVVVVEGQRDALRLIQEGINAVAVFGAGKLTNHTGQGKKLAFRLANNFSTVILAYDDDEPGKVGQDKALEALTHFGGNVVVFNCGNGKDPMSMPSSKVQELRRIVKEF